MVSVCTYLSLAEASVDVDVSAYQEFVRPLDYDFGLERGGSYLVFSIIEWQGAPWLYACPDESSEELSIFPAALFSLDGSTVPAGMIVRLTKSGRPSLELLPVELSKFDGWFERYVDGDEQIVEIVESVMRRWR